MALGDLIRSGLLLSIWLIVFSLGARTSLGAALSVMRKPAVLGRALFTLFVLVPAFAVLLAATAPVATAIKFAIVAMSVGPVPPILPYKQMKAGGDESSAVGLLVAAALASIVLTPLLLAVAARLLGAEAVIGSGQVARTVLLTIGLPLAAGMALRAVAEAVAQRLGAFAQRVGGLVLLAGLAAMVWAARIEILDLIGNGSVLAIIAAVGFGLLVGHLFATRRRSPVLALAAAARHPGVALAIAEGSFPEQQKTITAAILLYLLVTALVTAPYVKWARARMDAHEETPSPS